MSKKTEKIYERKESSSQWALHNGRIEFKTETIVSTFDTVLRDWIKGIPTIIWETVEQRGLLKQVEFYIVSYSEVPSLRKKNLKEKLWFKQKVTASIRDSEKFMFIYFNDSKQNIQGELVPVNQFFIKDINLGRTQKMGLNSDDYIMVEIGEDEAITQKEASEIGKKFNYVFDAVESQEDGDVYRQNVSKFISNPM